MIGTQQRPGNTNTNEIRLYLQFRVKCTKNTQTLQIMFLENPIGENPDEN